MANNRLVGHIYCRTGFDSDGLMATKIATKNSRYRKYNSLGLYRSCLLNYGTQSFLFLDDFEGNAKDSVAIKPGSTVSVGLQNLTPLIASLTAC